MSKKHKIAKKEAQAQKKLYEEEVLVENLENDKVKEVESGVIEMNDDSVSTLSEENNEIVIEETAETENASVKNDSEVKEVLATKPATKTEKVKDKNTKLDTKADNKALDKNKKDKDKKKKDKKNKKGLIKKTKETASELKKVTWPSFGEVVKKTGIVIAFVVIFGLLIFGVDTLLGFLSSLLV